MIALCKVCHRRLPISIRNILCACGLSFCSRHRHQHNCNIDYKHAQRSQLKKQNLKISNSGIRKGHFDEI